MVWIPVLAWVGAVAVAAVVLGFAGYEIWWKARRLHSDLARLTSLGDELGAVQRDLAEAQRRLGASRTPGSAQPDADR